LEIPKICKDDLVIIPEKLRQQLGGVCPVLLCYKVSTVIHLLDPLNMKVVDLSQEKYFHFETDIEIYSIKIYGQEFMVI
jgi:nonsense-mediated mRNA decay protein 3